MAANAERLQAQADRIVQLRRQKERRDGKAISQETAAYEIGVSVRTYRTWETQGAVIQFDNLKRLADYYGTSTTFIENGATLSTPDPLAAPDVKARLDRIEQLLEEVLLRLPSAIDGPPASELRNRLENAQPKEPAVGRPDRLARTTRGHRHP